jgi:hypothetical protein
MPVCHGCEDPWQQRGDRWGRLHCALVSLAALLSAPGFVLPMLAQARRSSACQACVRWR